jgi:hypothetical protein
LTPRVGEAEFALLRSHHSFSGDAREAILRRVSVAVLPQTPLSPILPHVASMVVVLESEAGICPSRAN